MSIMRMFKHCINQFEERVIYDLIDTPHKLRFVCGFMGITLNLLMNLSYNGLNDVLTSYTTPPWFGMFYAGKIPISIYCLTVIIGFVGGSSFGYWWGFVHEDIYRNGRKRWCIKQDEKNIINNEIITFEQKKEN